MCKATDVLLPRTLLGQWTRRAVGALPTARRAHRPSNVLCITKMQFLRERSKDVREPRPTSRDHFRVRYHRLSGSSSLPFSARRFRFIDRIDQLTHPAEISPVRTAG